MSRCESFEACKKPEIVRKINKDSMETGTHEQLPRDFDLCRGIVLGCVESLLPPPS